MMLDYDRCPGCDSNIGRDAYTSGKLAGDEWQCPVCDVLLYVEEHDDGCSTWYVFEEMPPLPPEGDVGA